MRLRPVLLDQREDGAFEARLTKSSLRTAKRLLGVDVRRLTLAAGSRKTVQVRWLRRPKKKRSAALGVLVEGRQSTGAKGGSQVRARAAILSLNFVQVPGSLRVRGGLIALRAEQAEKRKIVLLSRVGNRGRELARARKGRVVVRNADRRVVFKRRWGGQKLDLVLGGATVDFPVTIDEQLPAGRYSARTTVQFGSRRTTRTTTFTLVATNELPTRKLKITSVDATGKSGEPAHVRVRVRNIGTASSPLEADAELLRLGADGAENTVDEHRLRGETLKPGGSAVLEGDLGKLVAGRYRVDVTLQGGGGRTESASTQVLAKKDFSTTDRIRRFFTDHPTRTVVIIALIVIAGLVAALMRTRRAQRQ